MSAVINKSQIIIHEEDKARRGWDGESGEKRKEGRRVAYGEREIKRGEEKERRHKEAG